MSKKEFEQARIVLSLPLIAPIISILQWDRAGSPLTVLNAARGSCARRLTRAFPLIDMIGVRGKQSATTICRVYYGERINMHANPDFRQQAALKCLATGKLNAVDPYSGPYYRRAYQSVVQDALRRRQSQERRVATFFDSSHTRERYDTDVRYLKEGRDSDDPLKQVEAREEHQLLTQSLDCGDSDETELLIAHHLQGSSTSELARDRSTSESAIRARLRRDRHRIKRKLAACGLIG